MKTKRGITCAMAATVLLLGFQCIKSPVSNNGSGSTTETALVRGILYQPDGKTPAAGVRVHIRPQNTLADTSGTGLSKRAAVLAATDSVVTDSAGRYAFDTTLDTGTYVIEAASGNNASLIDSVPVKNKKMTDTLPPDTLKPMGALKGVINLSEGGDPRTVFVLAFGIDRFARVNADGSFKFAGLAEAKYDLRLISSLDNYGVLDTVGVAVRSGDTTDLGTIELPFTGIPTPKNVKISYDTARQIVTLTWDSANASLVSSYNIYRRNVGLNTVFARINTSPVTGTSYSDSTGAQDSTYEYGVAAVDKNATEGTKSAAVSVKILSFFVVDTIIGTCGGQPGQFSAPNDIAVDTNGRIYVVDDNTQRVQVFDSSLLFVRQFGEAFIQRSTGVTIDNGGHVLIADHSLQKVLIFGSSDSLVRSFSIPGVQKLKTNSKGQIIATSSKDSAYVCDTSGAILHQWGGTGVGQGQFNQPTFLTIDDKDNIYICDNLNNRIQEFDSLGNFRNILTLNDIPNGIEIEPQTQRVYVAFNSLQSSMVVFEPNGNFLAKCNGLNGPCGIALRNRTIYMTLSGFCRLVKLTSNLP